MFQYFDFPDISFIPLKLDDGTGLYIEMNLVYSKGRNLSEEAIEYMEYKKDLFEKTGSDI